MDKLIQNDGNQDHRPDDNIVPVGAEPVLLECAGGVMVVELEEANAVCDYENTDEDEQWRGEERPAMPGNQARFHVGRQMRITKAQRAAIGNDLRNAAEEQHSSERDNERLQAERGDEPPLEKAKKHGDAQ